MPKTKVAIHVHVTLFRVVKNSNHTLWSFLVYSPITPQWTFSSDASRSGRIIPKNSSGAFSQQRQSSSRVRTACPGHEAPSPPVKTKTFTDYRNSLDLHHSHSNKILFSLHTQCSSQTVFNLLRTLSSHLPLWNPLSQRRFFGQGNLERSALDLETISCWDICGEVCVSMLDSCFLRNFSRHNLHEMLEFLLLRMMDIAVLVSLGNFGRYCCGGSEFQLSEENYWEKG